MALITYDGETFEDESFLERMWGLREMFPKKVRSATSTVVVCSVDMSSKFYRLVRFSLWVGTASFIILCLPIVFEQERFNLEQQQQQHQRRMLLGPNAALTS